jgi:hypothetical protein
MQRTFDILESAIDQFETAKCVYERCCAAGRSWSLG